MNHISYQKKKINKKYHYLQTTFYIHNNFYKIIQQKNKDI